MKNFVKARKDNSVRFITDQGKAQILGGKWTNGESYQHIIKIEIDAEQQHEYRDDPLQIGAVTGDAVRLDAEAAGAGGAEGMHDAFK